MGDCALDNASHPIRSRTKKHHAVQQGIVTSRIGRRVRQARRRGTVTMLPPRRKKPRGYGR
jgi:hypothetical protein